MMQVLEYIRSDHRGNKSNYAPRYQNLRKMALFCAIVRAKIILFAGPKADPSMLSPYVLMNHIVGKNHITPACSEIRGKRPYSAQKSRGSTDQWTGARNTTDQVMAADLRGVLVAISIPIFTGQLEKAREATDLANIRSAYAEYSAAVLTETAASTNKDAEKGVVVTVDGTSKVVTAKRVVKLTQQVDKWTDSNGSNVAGQNISSATAQTVGATVEVTVTSTGDVKIEDRANTPVAP